MKAPAKTRMKKRRDRYVVGYLGARNTLYGKPYEGLTNWRLVDPLSLRAADRLLSVMPDRDCAIFELVPIKVNR